MARFLRYRRDSTLKEAGSEEESEAVKSSIWFFDHSYHEEMFRLFKTSCSLSVLKSGIEHRTNCTSANQVIEKVFSGFLF